MLQDALRETPVYQRILEEGREALRKELEQQQEVLEKMLQQQQMAFQRLREAAFDVTLRRFPHLAGLARDYARSIDDLYLLTRLVTRMATIPTVEGAEIFLEIMIEESKETK